MNTLRIKNYGTNTAWHVEAFTAALGQVLSAFPQTMDEPVDIAGWPVYERIDVFVGRSPGVWDTVFHLNNVAVDGSDYVLDVTTGVLSLLGQTGSKLPTAVLVGAALVAAYAVSRAGKRR